MSDVVAAIRPLKRTTTTLTIRWKGGFLTTSVDVLPGGILIQRENAWWEHTQGKTDSFQIRGGTVWVPNRKIAEATGGATRYARCVDLYEALRMAVHTQDRYGVASAHEGSEVEVVKGQIDNARGLSRMMQRRARLAREERRAFDTLNLLLVYDLQHKRDEHKLDAAEHFDRARQTAERDSRGRPNSMAAAMQIGAGIGELIQRVMAIGQIKDRVETREQVVAALIAESLTVYNALWSDLTLGQSARITKMMDAVGRASSPGAAPEERERTKRTLSELEAMFRGHRERLATIQAAPFRRNAYHAMQDLEQAESLCEPEKLSELRDCVARLKHGIRWVYPLNALQVDILLPLTMRIEYLRLLCRRKNLEISQKKFRPTFFEFLGLEQVSDHLRPSIDDLAVFAARLEKLSDDDLAVHVKERVKTTLSRARDAAGQKHWLSVRDHLRSISREIL